MTFLKQQLAEESFLEEHEGEDLSMNPDDRTIEDHNVVKIKKDEVLLIHNTDLQTETFGHVNEKQDKVAVDDQVNLLHVPDKKLICKTK